VAKEGNLNVRLPTPLFLAVKRAAKQSGDRDISTYVRRVLSEKLLTVNDAAPETEAQKKVRAILMMTKAVELLGGSLSAETKTILQGLKGE
jgi:hypothetical protein